MSAVTAVSQQYTERGSGVQKWCDGGQERCNVFQAEFLLDKFNLYFRFDNLEHVIVNDKKRRFL